MKVALGADHGGFRLKAEIKKLLDQLGIPCTDLGTFSEDSVDYPDFALEVAERVASGEFDRGIICCGTGIGVSIVANKVPGIRAALCHDTFSAKATREHNDSNILTMGERVVGIGLATEVVKVWLATSFSGERHARRIAKITEIEKKFGRSECGPDYH